MMWEVTSLLSKKKSEKAKGGTIVGVTVRVLPHCAVQGKYELSIVVDVHRVTVILQVRMIVNGHEVSFGRMIV